MKIYGDEPSSQFTYLKETGILYGHNDLFKGKEHTIHSMTHSIFGNTEEYTPINPKLYFHISNTPWTSFTGTLREYLLPWRWKVAYLEKENSPLPQRILVCTSVEGGLSDRLKLLLGQSLFVASLIKADYYDEILDQEFLRLPGKREGNSVIHPLGEWAGKMTDNTSDNLCHIYRKRDLFSTLRYYFLKYFSRDWEEVTLVVGQVAEKLLIKKQDRAILSEAGLLKQVDQTV